MATLAAYRLITRLAGPALGKLLERRQAQGKEDPKRIAERRGVPSRPRPDGPLIWLHAASVGEAQSALSLIERLVATRPRVSVLITTGTVTSAGLLENRLPARSFHQFIPLDRPGWVAAFLDHWRPDLALWLESELWPNLLTQTRERGIPAILINARISSRSFTRWRRFPGAARDLLATFDLCLAQSDQQAEWLRQLGATNVSCVGNLKFSAAPLSVANAALQPLRDAVGDRLIWLAASTHPGEERIAAEVHERLRPTRPDLLTVIVPRHPARADEIAAQLMRHALRVKRRSEDAVIEAADDIYLADTMGELGLFYRLAPIALIGGSFAGHGGHNPLEAAQLGCAVLHGPDMANFQTVADALDQAQAARKCIDAEAVATGLDGLLGDTAERNRQADAAKAVAEAHGNVLDQVCERLQPYLARLDQAHDQ